jgi:hypothetical protein
LLDVAVDLHAAAELATRAADLLLKLRAIAERALDDNGASVRRNINAALDLFEAALEGRR